MPLDTAGATMRTPAEVPSGESTITRIALLVAAVVGPLAAAPEESPRVSVYNWSEYIDEETLPEFESETGIAVTYDVYDSNTILERRLQEASAGYDVVVPSGSFLARQIQTGAFQELDKSRLGTLNNLDPTIMAQVQRWDPGNRFAVPYLWGTTGFTYDAGEIATRHVDAPTQSWRMLFDPGVVSRFADCGVVLLDGPDEVVPAALNYLGEDPDTHDANVIARAEPLLRAIRPFIRYFHNSSQIQDLANGEICLAMGWSGDMLQARRRATESETGVAVHYAIPDEGALMWFDLMAIPASAPHPGNAHRFIDHILRPNVTARISNHVFYANANALANPHLARALIEDPSIYPSSEVQTRLYVVRPYPANVQRFVDQLWARIRDGS